MLCLTICLELFGSGPLFHHDLLWPNLHVCYNEWWKHLLYFNNYNNMNETVIFIENSYNWTITILNYLVWHSNLVHRNRNATSHCCLYLLGSLYAKSTISILDCCFVYLFRNDYHHFHCRVRINLSTSGTSDCIYTIFVSI